MNKVGFSISLGLAVALAACNSEPETEETAPVIEEQPVLSPEEQAAAEAAFIKELDGATKAMEASRMAWKAPTPELRQRARDRAEELLNAK